MAALIKLADVRRENESAKRSGSGRNLIASTSNGPKFEVSKFEVSLSAFVTEGDESQGLVTVGKDPKAIQTISSLLSDPEFAAGGVQREDVLSIARYNSY